MRLRRRTSRPSRRPAPKARVPAPQETRQHDGGGTAPVFRSDDGGDGTRDGAGAKPAGPKGVTPPDRTSAERVEA
ncbi:hypothetical protein STXM2123_3853 [Streptomyces sp. F-3]|jgi:hypothetical protein|uniref:Uncharacterized protein n=1 Tax=Streptomyces thermogriseus TaxID=75292 RepID=A0ABN1T541_9ACTN|nr:hypothetical protein STXM2123_3853 [Streptomyces sp. F-3]